MYRSARSVNSCHNEWLDQAEKPKPKNRPTTQSLLGDAQNLAGSGPSAAASLCGIALEAIAWGPAFTSPHKRRVHL